MISWTENLVVGVNGDISLSLSRRITLPPLQQWPDRRMKLEALDDTPHVAAQSRKENKCFNWPPRVFVVFALQGRNTQPVINWLPLWFHGESEPLDAFWRFFTFVKIAIRGRVCGVRLRCGFRHLPVTVFSLLSRPRQAIFTLDAIQAHYNAHRLIRIIFFFLRKELYLNKRHHK